MRKNQALSIALILFVIIACVLGVTTYYFKKSADEALTDKVKAEQTLPEKDQKIDSLSSENQTLKDMIAGVDDMNAIIQKYNEAMKYFNQDENAGAVPDIVADDENEKPEGEEGQNEGEKPAEAKDGSPVNKLGKSSYDALVLQLREQIQANNELTSQIEELNSTIDSLKGMIDKAREEGRAQGEKVERDKFEAKIQNLEMQITEREKTINETNGLLKEQRRANKTEQKKTRRLEGEKKDLQKQIQERSEKIEKLEEIHRESKLPPAESKMGELVYVDPLGQQGNINLGKKDFLTRGITFSVYEPNNLTEYGMKGTIEVLSVTEDREAEVQIYNNDEKNPIKVGDVIYTPTWAPGFEEHFAIAGFVDIDGDNISDLDEVIRLIRQNGGIVDAWQKADGKMEGKMSSETSWLVLGRKPDEKSTQASLTTYTNMTRAADEYGTKVQQVKDLLRKMGYRPPADTTNFEVRPTVGTKGRSSTGSVSGLYSKEPEQNAPKRKPPRSAY